MSTDVLSSTSSGSKLDVLVTKLHKFLAQSTGEGSEASQMPGHWNGSAFANQMMLQSTHHGMDEPSINSENRKPSPFRSKRKSSVVTRHSGLDESDCSLDSGSEDAVSNNSDVNVHSLPKGTVVVRPQPVSNEVRDEFRGPEFRNRRTNKQNRGDYRQNSFDLQIVSCTACGQQVNHFQKDSFFQHPVLKVLICKACFRYYMSDDISKDTEGMDEQCRWCAEGGSLIGCDYCSNAFCKKCVLRNFGRKELSAITDEDRKWYCYVCSPEPLLGLVLACDTAIQNLQQICGPKRPRSDTDRTKVTGPKGKRTQGQVCRPISAALTQRTERLVEMTVALNRSFVAFVQTTGEDEDEEEEEDKMNQLQAYTEVLVDLRKAHDALQQAVQAELQRRGRGPRPTHRARRPPRTKVRTGQAGVKASDVTKQLVVKLTPVPVDSGTNVPKTPKETEGSCHRVTTEVTEDAKREVGVGEGPEEALSVEEDSRRSPRVKTTPLRRTNDHHPQVTESHSEHAERADGHSLAPEHVAIGEDSDSDEVPAILLQTANMAMSSGEGESEGGDGESVTKSRLFGLVKSAPPSQERAGRKRKLQERPSSPSSSSSSSSVTRAPGTQSRRKVVPQVATPPGHSSSSEMGACGSESAGCSDDGDQKIKPITEGVSLLGAGTFQQSSGDEAEAVPGPSHVLDDDDVENRIAKKILLAQVQAGLSSTSEEDVTTDEEDKRKEEECQHVESKVEGEPFPGSSSDLSSDSDADGKPNKTRHRHALLRHGLTLNEDTPRGDTQNETGQVGPKVRRPAQDTDTSEEELSGSEAAVSVELSLSEDEAKSSVSEKEVPDFSETASAAAVELDDGEDVLGDITNTLKVRKKIRAIMDDEQLGLETRQALREEEERRRRLAERVRQREEEERRAREIEEDDEDDVVIVLERPGPVPLVLEYQEGTREPLVKVHHHLVRELKPHQREGVKFIWDSCCESVQKATTSPGSGCILAHCMGLGKTLQVVAFLHTMLKCSALNFHTALVVCPLNTILNWLAEFAKWQRGMEAIVKVSELTTTSSSRVKRLLQWQIVGGVMIMGYDMFRKLTTLKGISSSILEEEIHKALIDPGPDFVVCDEGHVLKNDATSISKAMSSIRTRRRVLLTGTPLQNSLSEYHCMVSFVKENLLGSISEFRNRFMNPIQNGQCSDSTPADVRLMKNRAHVLYHLLAGCVQRQDYSVLTQFLPLKCEYVLAVRLTPIQSKLYMHYLKNYTGGDSRCCIPRMGTNLFRDMQVLSRVWTHPRCLKLDYISKAKKGCTDGRVVDSTEARMEDDSDMPLGNLWVSDIDQETPGPSVQGCLEEGMQPAGPPMDWYKAFVTEDDTKIMQHSGKMVLLFEILRLSKEQQDKVLVFSQSLISLNLIEEFLMVSNTTASDDSAVPSPGLGTWVRNKDYYRIDGSTSVQTRKKLAQEFNNVKNQRGRLFLISTRAGSLGTNLVAANRVVVFDASWNPSHDLQSVFRVYRFGQVKPVFVYRFLAHGTMEQKIYERQVAKQSLSFRVLDHQQIQRHFTQSQLSELYCFQPELQYIPTKSNVEHTDIVLEQLLQTCGQHIAKIHEHDSLLDHHKEEELTEEERQVAWAEYRAEQARLAGRTLSNEMKKQEKYQMEKLQEIRRMIIMSKVGFVSALPVQQSVMSENVDAVARTNQDSVQSRNQPETSKRS
ncbi:ATRX chromatin remodeler, like isoform X2 [Denticeps clupeoides]|uniref:ATRX chromatin remodeler, like isoform X2 n=1 Tax=Denticeps clupeoides TaxID=299321 RepID=UPI0010A58442|nr:transcriptional regulator ATRX-like isoform X2 [Denticeps clupeoides]